MEIDLAFILYCCETAAVMQSYCSLYFLFNKKWRHNAKRRHSFASCAAPTSVHSRSFLHSHIYTNQAFFLISCHPRLLFILCCTNFRPLLLFFAFSSTNHEFFLTLSSPSWLPFHLCLPISIGTGDICKVFLRIDRANLHFRQNREQHT